VTAGHAHCAAPETIWQESPVAHVFETWKVPQTLPVATLQVWTAAESLEHRVSPAAQPDLQVHAFAPTLHSCSVVDWQSASEVALRHPPPTSVQVPIFLESAGSQTGSFTFVHPGSFVHVPASGVGVLPPSTLEPPSVELIAVASGLPSWQVPTAEQNWPEGQLSALVHGAPASETTQPLAKKALSKRREARIRTSR
jgi:hypothetical protein